MCAPDGEVRDKRPNPRSAIANLRGTGLPWRRLLARVAANNWLKLRSARNCCGNYREPGC